MRYIGRRAAMPLLHGQCRHAGVIISPCYPHQTADIINGPPPREGIVIIVLFYFVPVPRLQSRRLRDRGRLLSDPHAQTAQEGSAKDAALLHQGESDIDPVSHQRHERW